MWLHNLGIFRFSKPGRNECGQITSAFSSPQSGEQSRGLHKLCRPVVPEVGTNQRGFVTSAFPGYQKVG